MGSLWLCVIARTFEMRTRICPLGILVYIICIYTSRVCRQQNSVRIVQTCILFNKLYTLSVRTQLANGNVENACWLCVHVLFVRRPPSHAHPPAQNTQEQGVTKVSMLSHEEYIAKQIYSKHVRGSAHAYHAQLSNQKTFSRFFVCDGVDPAAGPGYIYALREHRARVGAIFKYTRCASFHATGSCARESHG